MERQQTPPAPAGWVTRSTRYFEFQYPPSLSPLADQVAVWADARLEQSADVLEVKPGRKYVVRFAGDDRTFYAIQPGRAPDWAGGTAYPEQGLMILRTSKLPLIPGSGGLETTFTHETVHLLLGEIGSEARIPRWLHEGTARLLAGETSLDEWTLLGQAALFKRLIPLDELDRRFPSDEGRAALAYAQSRAFLSFLTERFGAPVLGGLIRQMAAGNNLNDALWAQVGMGLTLLEDDWLDHFQTGYTWLTVFTGGMSLWGVCGGLLILAYRRKRKQSQERRARWELEEAALYPDDEDVYEPFPAILPLRVVTPLYWHAPPVPAAAPTTQPPRPAWWPEGPGAPERRVEPRVGVGVPVVSRDALPPSPVLPPDDDDEPAIPTGRDRAPDGSWLH